MFATLACDRTVVPQAAYSFAPSRCFSVPIPRFSVPATPALGDPRATLLLREAGREAEKQGFP